MSTSRTLTSRFAVFIWLAIAATLIHSQPRPAQSPPSVTPPPLPPASPPQQTPPEIASYAPSSPEPVSPSHEPEPEPSATAPPVEALIPLSVNEGCVAVEHLAGAAVQHAAPLLRPVLCARGLCATPNHALIVDGVWTSMRALCATRWRCTHATRLVNNLKIAHATRLRFDDRIVITPYDARFPVLVPWFVQIAQDVADIIFVALRAAATIAAAVLVHAHVVDARRIRIAPDGNPQQSAPREVRVRGAPCAARVAPRRQIFVERLPHPVQC